MIHEEENQQWVHGWCWGLPLWYPLSPHYHPLGVYGQGKHNWLHRQMDSTPRCPANSHLDRGWSSELACLPLSTPVPSGAQQA